MLALLVYAFGDHGAETEGLAANSGDATAAGVPTGAEVVKAGLRIRKLGPVDEDDDTFAADFDIWFVGARPFDPSDLIFANAAAPIRLSEPRAVHAADGDHYCLYYVEGKFRYRASVQDLFTGHLRLRVAILSASAPRSQLVLVPDLAGSQLAPATYDGGSAQTEDERWNVVATTLGERALDRTTLGNPAFTAPRAEHSELVATVLVARTPPNIHQVAQRLIPPFLAGPLAVAMLALLAGSFLARGGSGASRGAWRFIARLIAATLLLAAVENLVARYVPALLTPGSARVVLGLLRLAWSALLAASLIGLVPILLWRPMERHTGAPPSTLERMAVNVIILLAVGLVFLSTEFNWSATSIGAASGVLTLVLGVALQDLILDVFSGVLLSLEKPFRLMHWVTVISPHMQPVVGQVHNMNWRTTRLYTRDNDIVTVPNSVMAKSRVINHADPSMASRLRLDVIISAKWPTSTVLHAMKSGALNSARSGLILEQPAPTVVIEGVEEDRVHYGVYFYTNFNLLPDSTSMGSVAENVLRALDEAGFDTSPRILTWSVDGLQDGRGDHPPHDPRPVVAQGAGGNPAPPAHSAAPANVPVGEEDVRLVRESWAAIQGSQADLAVLFYDRLFEVAPAVRPMFRSDHTMQRTKFLLMLGLLIKTLDQPDALREILADFGLRHEAYGAKPEHYAVVGATLLWALEQVGGQALDERTKTAWGNVYTAVADMMIRKP
jgi:small-conductance mechanosensitive channel/hemoglobin-like flavoprotein